MTDAPERIYTTGTKAGGSWNAETASTARIKVAETEYTRADIHQAALQAAYAEGLEAAAREAEMPIDWENGADHCNYIVGYEAGQSDAATNIRALPNKYEATQ